MTIWILALVLLGCSAAAGFSMGVVRVGISLVGLLVATLLAFPLGHLVSPIVGLVGIKNPFLVWLTGPFVIFVLVLVAFKVAALFVHRKVDVYYKYKAGDLRMGLWNRSSARLGLALGLVNGTIYLILIGLVIYILSYPTTQMVIGDNGAFSVKTLNLMGGDLYKCGLSKVEAAIDPMPEAYYTVSDMIGLVYHNDLLEARLARYPAFLSLAERPQFQDIANDKEFAELRQRQPSFAEIMDHPKAQAILGNPDMLKEIWSITEPNLKDLAAFLRTGQSATFDGEKILGRWTLDLNGALNLVKRNKPNISAVEIQRVKWVLTMAFSKTTLIAAPDKQVFVKNFGSVKPPTNPKAQPTVEFQTLTGQWASDGGNKYQFNIGGRPSLEGVVEGDKLTVTGDALPMRFDKEY
jgi:Colicin V production protein